MALRLFVLTGDIDPLPSVLVKGRRAVIGRGPAVDVRLPDPSVSLHHATIIKRGSTYLITDEGSAHGTGAASGDAREPVWLAPDSPRVIEDGERIWIGQIELEVHFETAKRGAATGYDELASTLVRAGLTAAGVEASDEMVESTLEELTDLPEETFEEPEYSEATEEIGVVALREDDRNPPWKTDVFVAAIAVVILAGCAFGMLQILAIG